MNWIKYVEQRINQYKDEIRQAPSAKGTFYKNIIDDVREKLGVYTTKGADRKLLAGVFNDKFAEYRNVA